MVRIILCTGLLLIGCSGVPDTPIEAPTDIDFTFWDPSFHREVEVSLNGTWSFDTDPEGTGERDGWHLPGKGLQKQIRVPFPWGSALSGQGARPPEGGSLQGGTEAVRRNYRGKAWYARTVQVPADWPYATTLVRFGAVDWRCRVFVNGEVAGSHEGGFDPFEVDVTRWAVPGGSFYLALEVEDRCDEDPASLTGKQGGIWYSCVGGIWQDVALVGRPRSFVEKVILEPEATPGTSRFKAILKGLPGQATVRIAWRCLPQCPAPCTGHDEVTLQMAHEAEATFFLSIPPEDEWHPDSACLATFRVELTTASGRDQVDGYFGVRRLGRGKVVARGDRTLGPKSDVIMLNDRPFFVRAVLDQCWDPDGLLAASSLDRRRADFQFMKDAGFNTVRLHLKPEEPRVLALADAMGLAVIADMPSPPPGAGKVPDAPWVAAWDNLFQAMLDRDRNHPSIIWWTLFNEAWGLQSPPFWAYPEGLDFVRDKVRMARQSDASRFIEDNSATLGDGHVDSDIASWHFYSTSVTMWKDLLNMLEFSMTTGGDWLRKGGGTWTGEPFINTEFGGLGADDTRGDHGWLLHGIMNVLRSSPSLAGYVFTEAYDVEWERNGLMTFDRRPKDFGLDDMALSLKDLFGENYLVLGQEPGLASSPGSAFSIPVGFSTLREINLDLVRFRLRDLDRKEDLRSWEKPGVLCGPGFTSLEPADGVFPKSPGVYVLQAEAWSSGVLVARNAMYLVSHPGDISPVNRQGFALLRDAEIEGVGECTVSACWCVGTCALRFSLHDIAGLVAHGGAMRLSGEFSAYDSTVPQTGAVNPVASRMEVWWNGHRLAESNLPPARHDHRGVLSWIYAGTSLKGAYGEFISLDLGIETPKEGDVLVLKGIGGGLMVFFEYGGRFLSPLALEVTYH